MEVTDSVCKGAKRMINFSFTWTLGNLTSSLNEEFIESRPFAAENDPGTKWHLLMFPKIDKGESKGYISLFLILESSETNEIQAKFSFACMIGCARLVKANKEEKEMKEFTSNQGRGWGKFVLRDSLLKNGEADLPCDKLELRCEISYASQIEGIPSNEPQAETRCDVTGVLAELYESRARFDVVLDLDGKEFQAHRAILAARWPILKGIFELDRKAGKISRIDVSIMTEQTLEDLLRFIYTVRRMIPST